MGLEKGQTRIDAEETISSREKVMEMIYSLSLKTRMTGYHRKATGARLGTHKRRLPFGQHSNDLVLKDAQEDPSLAGPHWRLNEVTETKPPKVTEGHHV